MAIRDFTRQPMTPDETAKAQLFFSRAAYMADSIIDLINTYVMLDIDDQDQATSIAEAAGIVAAKIGCIADMGSQLTGGAPMKGAASEWLLPPECQAPRKEVANG